VVAEENATRQAGIGASTMTASLAAHFYSLIASAKLGGSNLT
jgi:hypothetical protein